MTSIRLNKYLSDLGVASRRASDTLIEKGKVTVNHQVASLGSKIDPTKDTVQVGKKIFAPQKSSPPTTSPTDPNTADTPYLSATKKYYFLLYKPAGYVTTTKDENNRPTVMKLLPPKLKTKKLYPVGRLDMDTTGVLLFTNDGDLTYKLTHPSHEAQKVYEAKIDGIPTDRELKQFRRGLRVAHRTTAPADIEIIKQFDHTTLVKITLHEGRHRQIKRMCLAINHPVLTLKRIEFAGLNLGTLATGTGRELTTTEVDLLKKSTTHENPHC
jgi:23S rRNA pseudouridine2605 synthase